MKPTRIPSRYHRIDGWRGYSIPGCAVAGASDTGTWDDSPCPTPEVRAELRRFMRTVLRPAGIHSRIRYGVSSNVFCAKAWVCVSAADWPRAFDLANTYIDDDDRGPRSLRYLHDARGDREKTKAAA